MPFRLTPDMVDGLGTSGTQGVFQRCAEETLRVLRDGSDVILTVLEVFKYDPLHSWYESSTVFRSQGLIYLKGRQVKLKSNVRREETQKVQVPIQLNLCTTLSVSELE